VVRGPLWRKSLPLTPCCCTPAALQDLQRCQVRYADAIMVLTNKNSSTPDEEDAHSIMVVMALGQTLHTFAARPSKHFLASILNAASRVWAHAKGVKATGPPRVLVQVLQQSSKDKLWDALSVLQHHPGTPSAAACKGTTYDPTRHSMAATKVKASPWASRRDWLQEVVVAAAASEKGAGGVQGAAEEPSEEGAGLRMLMRMGSSLRRAVTGEHELAVMVGACMVRAL
jgi:hypothetical protein